MTYNKIVHKSFLEIIKYLLENVQWCVTQYIIITLINYTAKHQSLGQKNKIENRRRRHSGTAAVLQRRQRHRSGTILQRRCWTLSGVAGHQERRYKNRPLLRHRRRFFAAEQRFYTVSSVNDATAVLLAVLIAFEKRRSGASAIFPPLAMVSLFSHHRSR